MIMSEILFYGRIATEDERELQERFYSGKRWRGYDVQSYNIMSWTPKEMLVRVWGRASKSTVAPFIDATAVV